MIRIAGLHCALSRFQTSAACITKCDTCTLVKSELQKEKRKYYGQVLDEHNKLQRLT